MVRLGDAQPHPRSGEGGEPGYRPWLSRPAPGPPSPSLDGGEAPPSTPFPRRPGSSWTCGAKEPGSSWPWRGRSWGSADRSPKGPRRPRESSGHGLEQGGASPRGQGARPSPGRDYRRLGLSREGRRGGHPGRGGDPATCGFLHRCQRPHGAGGPGHHAGSRGAGGEHPHPGRMVPQRSGSGRDIAGPPDRPAPRLTSGPGPIPGLRSGPPRSGSP